MYIELTIGIVYIEATAHHVHMYIELTIGIVYIEATARVKTCPRPRAIDMRPVDGMLGVRVPDMHACISMGTAPMGPRAGEHEGRMGPRAGGSNRTSHAPEEATSRVDTDQPPTPEIWREVGLTACKQPVHDVFMHQPLTPA